MWVSTAEIMGRFGIAEQTVPDITYHTVVSQPLAPNILA
jgi:hypothetical protein